LRSIAATADEIGAPKVRSNLAASANTKSRWATRLNEKRILRPLPVIPRYPKTPILSFHSASCSASMSSPRGPIEPGRASQTPEIGSPADRAGGNDESRKSRVPRGTVGDGRASDGEFARRRLGNRSKGRRPCGGKALSAMGAAARHAQVAIGVSSGFGLAETRMAILTGRRRLGQPERRLSVVTR
jgi:hypothetical protein